nr:uncharacterized serine-rich protein C215.13-like [Ipomoea batatas]GMD38799.1 uncharacterized serine-rich protein C215.13-like [Ipomoea batatas]
MFLLEQTGTSSCRFKSQRPEFHHHFRRSLSPSDRFCSSASSSTQQHATLLTGSVSPPVRLSAAARNRSPRKSNQKRTCMCSPTIHPGSFRCSLHKHRGHGQATPYLSKRRSVNKSSLVVRIGTVESDLLAKRALAIHIRPSSHSLRRRFDFQLRPSRLSQMSKAEDA